MGALQRRSYLAARISQRIAADAPTREEAFTASMLHAVGLLVLAQSDPYELGEVIAAARERGVPLQSVEYEWRGSSHAELGAYVLGMWGLPDTIVEGGAHQHRAERIFAPVHDPALVVHVASALAAKLVPDAVAAPAGALDDATLAAAGLTKHVTGWRTLATAEAAGGWAAGPPAVERRPRLLRRR